MVALPAGCTLDLARAWFDDPTGPHRHIALQILEAHATSADVPRVRAALLPALRRDTAHNAERYMQCGILEVLARFPDHGPYPEAETAFEEAGYAWTRWRAAEVLAASGRGHFSRGFAVECLWDCEERVRQSGCAYVDQRNPDASDRLQALVRDPREDERSAEGSTGAPVCTAHPLGQTLSVRFRSNDCHRSAPRRCGQCSRQRKYG